MSDDKKTFYDILIAGATLFGGAIAYLFGYKKRRVETKVSEIDLDEKLDEINEKRTKKLIDELFEKDRLLGEKDKALQDAWKTITDLRIQVHQILDQMDDLKRKIAAMSLTHK